MANLRQPFFQKFYESRGVTKFSLMTNALFLSWWEGDVYSFFRALIISNTNSITSPYDSAFGKLTIFFENRTFNYLKRQ